MGRRRRSASLEAVTRSASEQFNAAVRERLPAGAERAQPTVDHDEEVVRPEQPKQISARERKRQERLAKRAERRGVRRADDGEYKRTRSEYTKFKYLSVAQIETIHDELIRKFADDDDPIGSTGPVDGGRLLRSAVIRPHTGMRLDGKGEAKYPTIETAASALVHSLIHNHPFPDGNKRTATLALIAFLYENKRLLIAESGELYDAIVAVARHQFPRSGNVKDVGDFASGPDQEVSAFAVWLKGHMVDLDRAYRQMQWRKLRTLLERRGCRVSHGQGNSIRVTRPGQGVSFIGARNDGDELDASTIAKVMKDLKLPSLHTPLAKERKGPLTFIEESIGDWREVLFRLGELDRGIVRSQG